LELSIYKDTMEFTDCPVAATLEVIGGKWKPLILFHLRDRAMRFSELRRVVPQATQKMLTQQLRDLERDGIIHRKVYAVVPPKVDYSLTAYGQTLKPLLALMCAWGSRHRSRATVRRGRTKTARSNRSAPREVSGLKS
jgi:DNA-binding HxlR family transcriptional regulator